ncbi:MAG: DUF4912 domain-containing protein [Spirochaetaceae bacterium]|nr:MAG: DUF4912 domain-containing protein [Spirochaetaceae bacterium]
MTKESLQLFTLEELVALARDEGYEGGAAADRATLIEFILENLKESVREEQEENSPSIQVEDSKYQITEFTEKPAVEDWPITDRYNQSKIVFMVRDPHWAFAYWDLENSCLEKLRADAENLILRVYEADTSGLPDSGVRSSFDIPIQLGDWSWYIYLPNQNCPYVLELGINADGKYRCLARSNTARTPRESVAKNQDSALEPFTDFDTHSASTSSAAIPQRILAGGRE